MFGLTKREQRWKAEQQAAEMLAGLVAVAIRGSADASIAQAQADTAELARLRDLYYELLYAVGIKHPGETRHQTVLRYIQQAEAPRAAPMTGESLNPPPPFS